MKKSIIFLFSILITVSVFSQNKESTALVMYFKADLACCKARACATIENDVKSIVEKNYTNGNVVFKQVRISDPESSSIVEQYSAKSQTVIIAISKKNIIKSVDASYLVKEYIQTSDKKTLEEKLVELINENLNK